VKTELRLLAALAALSAPRLAAEAPAFVVPVIVASETRTEMPAPSPAVSFAIPKYALTPQERETVAACLVLEAASQGDFGMRGVMAVIRNRARGRPELFAPTVLREKQFSALNNLTAGRESLWRTITRAQRDPTWPIALAIVDDAVDDAWNDPTGGATHYTRTGERTGWTRSLAMTCTIGAHAFYR
jgi:spore germination cell wall hydrolase CwlJ-like protein